MKYTYNLIILVLIFIFINSCKENFEHLSGLKNTDIILKTQEHIITSPNSIDFNVQLKYSANNTIEEYGVCWSENSTPTINDNSQTEKFKYENLTISVTNIELGKELYFRAFVKLSYGIVYEDSSIQINTPDGLATFDNGFLSNITVSSVNLNTKIIDNGGFPIVRSGICLSESANPTIEDSVIIVKLNENNLTYDLLDLDRGTNYFLRAFAENFAGIAYGEILNFTTKTGVTNITSLLPISVSNNSAIINGLIDNRNGATIKKYGFCFSKKTNPSMFDSTFILKDKPIYSEFQYSIPNLNEGNIYYYRAFAINQFDTVLGVVKQFYTNNYTFQPSEYVTVEGGIFIMGNNQGQPDEKPEHEITLSSFQMSIKEVTINQYIEFLKTLELNENGHVNMDGIVVGYTQYSSQFLEETPISYVNNNLFFNSNNISPTPDHSAYYVSYYGAKAYCEWVGGRLPTEAEWEFAAKGGILNEGYIYSGSNNLDEVAWYSNNSNNKIQPGGLKLANELGLYDMLGNALEICFDMYSSDFYSNSTSTNPICTENTDNIVLRGGAYNSTILEITKRDHFAIYNSGENVGFRVVKDIE